MWSAADVEIEIEDADPPVLLVKITTPAGIVDLIGSVAIVGRVMEIDGAHIGGLAPGSLGRSG
jgi:hypothetical protein